jgi:hypothetical protein
MKMSSCTTSGPTCPVSVASIREFCVGLLTSKIEAKIGELGEMINWQSDEVVVTPVALAAKQTLLRFVPCMLPEGSDEGILYRLVIEHGALGIHNMTIL